VLLGHADNNQPSAAAAAAAAAAAPVAASGSSKVLADAAASTANSGTAKPSKGLFPDAVFPVTKKASPPSSSSPRQHQSKVSKASGNPSSKRGSPRLADGLSSEQQNASFPPKPSAPPLSQLIDRQDPSGAQRQDRIEGPDQRSRSSIPEQRSRTSITSSMSFSTSSSSSSSSGSSSDSSTEEVPDSDRSVIHGTVSSKENTSSLAPNNGAPVLPAQPAGLYSSAGAGEAVAGAHVFDSHRRGSTPDLTALYANVTWQSRSASVRQVPKIDEETGTGLPTVNEGPADGMTALSVTESAHERRIKANSTSTLFVDSTIYRPEVDQMIKR
jgi:hypothetical protein